MCFRYSISLILSIFFFSRLAAVSPEHLEQLFAQGIKVDLREPHFCEGVLTTEKGGVITAPDMRIQARKIVYTRKTVEGKSICMLTAEGDLIVEFGRYLFVGSRLEFDFQTKKGVISDGRSSVEPWFFGGERIELCADGTYVIQKGYLTTSENVDPDWQVTIQEATISQDLQLNARKIALDFEHMRLFQWPSYSMNLAEIGQSPLSYTVRWGGHQGPRVGITYEAFSWRRFTTFLRLDYRLNRGPGFGIETDYTSEDHLQSLETISYGAMDSSLVHPNEKFRYRLQGIYSNKQFGEGFSAYLLWDKLSDKYMATDYYDKGLELDTAQRTQLHVRHEHPDTITNFFVRIKANSFQTVKEELPSLQNSWRPIDLNDTGIIVNTQAKASYLDFRYANFLTHVHDYDSSRLEYTQKFYRPIQIGGFNALPQAGGTAIYYNNTPLHRPRWLAAGILGFDLNTRLQRIYGDLKHVVMPYANYSYITFPTTKPHDHFIFDIDDGWYRLNMVRFGVRQFLYTKDCLGLIERRWSLDLWANAFFNTETIPQTIPKAYSCVSVKSSPTLLHTLETAWDLEFGMLDHFNYRIEWTFSADLALAMEYRHRDSLDWRKADHENFILDSFRTIHQLRHSSLSDRRDTLLFHIFYRLHPNWAFEFQSRQGWNRRHEKGYSEFEIALLTTLRSAWNFRLSFRHQQDDDRFAVNFSMALRRPDLDKCLIPCLDF